MADFISIHRVCICLLAIFFAGETGAQDGRDRLHAGPPPDWVQSIEWSDPEAAALNPGSGSVEFLLQEWQYHVARTERFERSVRRILSPAGVQEESSFSVSFDPDYEEVFLHTLHLIRDGEILDRLKLSDFQILQRERGLEAHLLDGTMSAVVFLEDVRVGDILEWSCTVRGNNPVFQGKVFQEFYTNWSVPVKRSFHRVLSPESRPLQFGAAGFVPSSRMLEGRDGDLLEFTRSGFDIPAVRSEDETPYWFSPYSRIYFTEIRDWAEVVDWGFPLFQVPSPSSPLVLAEAERILSMHDDAEGRALEALRFVQDSVRYLGIHSGLHTHLPNPPDLVMQRKFGDCKDKAVLLIQLLRDLEIEAYPVLVHTQLHEKIGELLPSPHAFDHVIVHLKVDGRSYWVDGTSTSLEGALADLHLEPYGLGLILREGETQLSPVNQPSHSKLEIFERFIPGDPGTPIRLEVRSEHTGRRAGSVKNFFARNDSAYIEQAYLEFLVPWYPGIQVAEPLRYEEENGMIVVFESYSINDLWNDTNNFQQNAFTIYPQAIFNSVPRTQERLYPLGLTFPDKVVCETEVVVPADWEWTTSEYEMADEALHFEHTVSAKPGLLLVRYAHEILRDHVTPDQVSAHLALRKEIRDLLHYTIYEEGDARLDNPPFQLNVPLTLMFGCMLLIWTAGAVRVFHIKAVPFSTPPPLNPKLAGLSGWLVLVGLGLGFRLVSQVTEYVDLAPLLDQNFWTAITNKDSEAYNPPQVTLTLIAAFWVAFSTAFYPLLCALFLAKRKIFPSMFILGMCLPLLVLLIFSYYMTQADYESEDLTQISAEFGSTLLGACIWIPYMLVSKRVHATFRT